MLKSKYRQRLDNVHIGIGMFFSKLGLTPNTWTALSLIPAFLGFLFLFWKNLAAALVMFLISGFLDIIDGNVARVTKSVTNLGAFMDGVIDRYVEFALYLGLYFYLDGVPEVLGPNAFWLLILVFGALMPSFVTAYADHRQVIQNDEALKNLGGVIERFERLILVCLGMFFGMYQVTYLIYFIILTAVLTNVGAIQRIIAVMEKS